MLIQAGLLAATAFQLKPLDGWVWYLADAAASPLLGVLDTSFPEMEVSRNGDWEASCLSSVDHDESANLP